MRNVRYLISDQFQAENIAEDLRIQLDINRFHNVFVTSVEQRNEVIVQISEESGSLEEAIGGFMENYQSGVILE